MMPDREKVKRALRACYSADIEWCQAREKGLCDYKVSYCRMALFKDAAELLEAQEPRVMMLDEIRHFVYGTPYIIETNLPGDEPRLMYGLYSHNGVAGNFDFATVNERVHLFDSDYGIIWRCWTSRPTDTQREATPWQNQS